MMSCFFTCINTEVLRIAKLSRKHLVYCIFRSVDVTYESRVVGKRGAVEPTSGLEEKSGMKKEETQENSSAEKERQLALSVRLTAC